MADEKLPRTSPIAAFGVFFCCIGVYSLNNLHTEVYFMAFFGFVGYLFVRLGCEPAPLLSRVSGLSSAVANSIVRWRDANGAFKNRKQLMDVAGLGAKTFAANSYRFRRHNLATIEDARVELDPVAPAVGELERHQHRLSLQDAVGLFPGDQLYICQQHCSLRLIEYLYYSEKRRPAVARFRALEG